jgi:hypothetical protein
MVVMDRLLLLQTVKCRAIKMISKYITECQAVTEIETVLMSVGLVPRHKQHTQQRAWLVNRLCSDSAR